MIFSKCMKITKLGGAQVIRLPQAYCDVLDIQKGDYAKVSLREDGVIEVVFEKDKLTEFKKKFKQVGVK